MTECSAAILGWLAFSMGQRRWKQLWPDRNQGDRMKRRRNQISSNSCSRNLSQRPCPGAQIDKTPWTDSNATALNKSTKAEVVAFLNGLRDPGTAPLESYQVGPFKWIDLAGNGRAELLVGISGPAASWSFIYWQKPTGSFKFQVLSGGIDLKTGIRDLNGDGKKELIVDTPRPLRHPRRQSNPCLAPYLSPSRRAIRPGKQGHPRVLPKQSSSPARQKACRHAAVCI